jgi:hypothetical protein
MTTIALRRGRVGGAAKAKRAKKAKRARTAAVSTEYNMLLTATLCLLALGAVMVFSASSTTRILQDGGLSDSAFYLKRTLIFGAVGLVVMHLVARFSLTTIRRLTPALLAVALFLLVAVLGIGTNVNGASRWIGGGSLQIQPSELAKVALILYGADMLAREPKRSRSLQGFMPFLLVVGGACLLIMLEGGPWVSGAGLVVAEAGRRTGKLTRRGRHVLVAATGQRHRAVALGGAGASALTTMDRLQLRRAERPSVAADAHRFRRVGHSSLKAF